MKRKVILSLHIANELLEQGFRIIELRPSRTVRGNAVFIFEATNEFHRVLNDISKRDDVRL